MTLRRRRGGFVLLMALAIITLATLLLAGISRRSLQFATQANEAEQRLQRRWGSSSCQRCMLDSAATIFKQSDRLAHLAGNQPKCRLAYNFELGGEKYEVVLADEDAKVNLNTVFVVDGAGAAAQIVKRLTANHPKPRLVVSLHGSPPSRRDADARPFRSWGQVFRGEQDASDTAEGIRTITSELTCWGSGKLNLSRASDAAVSAICEGWLDVKSVERLLELRQRDAGWGVAMIVNRLQPKERQREKFMQRITDNSTCYSLWIVAQGAHNSRHELHISETGIRSRSEASIPVANRGGSNLTEKTNQRTHFIW